MWEGFEVVRLWNGVAKETVTMQPTNGIGSDTLYSSETIQLKSNKDAYTKIRRSDWRLLFEASYQWRN